MIAEIKFACAHCGQRIAVGPEAAGLDIDCPTCQNGVTIPAEAAPMQPRRAEGGQRERIAALQAECERLRANATHAQAELKSFHNERLTLRGDVASWKQRVAVAEEQVADLELVRRRLEATESQLAAMEQALSENHAALTQVSGEHALAVQEIESFRSQLALAARQKIEAEATKSHLVETEARLVEIQGTLAKAVADGASLDQRRGIAESEVENLRALMARDEATRELLSIRSKLATADAELQTRRQSSAQIAADLEKAEAERARLEDERIALHQQLAAAEKTAEERSEHRLHADNQKLRELLERQKEELKLRFRELTRYRRAKLTVKVVWAVAALIAVGLGFAFVKLLPSFELVH